MLEFSFVNMVAVGAKVAILKPSCLKRGYYFQKCRRYKTAEGIFYDYFLKGPDGKSRKLASRGPRKLLFYKFPLKAGGVLTLDVHRVFAFNAGCCNPRGLCWSLRAHVHHKPKPRRKPWSNNCAANLQVMTGREHAQWHRANLDVPSF